MIKTTGFGYEADVTSHFVIRHEAAAAVFVEHNHRPLVKVSLPLSLWRLIADPIKADFNVRLRERKMKAGRWANKGETPLERLLGKEATLLAWAVEGATEDQIDFAIRNWQGLRPEERWWLYTTANATYNLPSFGPDRGWRRALRIAFTDNPTNALAAGLTS